MSKRIKSPIQYNKISSNSIHKSECCSEQCPWFSFKYLTKNSEYNLSRLSGKNAEITLRGMYSKLQELSGKTWLDWSSFNKKVGFETLEYQDLNFKADKEDIAKDTKIYVFRFDTYKGNGEGRILGYKESPCSVMHIIGFDINFNAYKH